MSVQFKNNSAKVKAAMNEKAIAWLYEASGELEAQVKRNTVVGTGQLKNSWTYKVDESKGESKIGSPLEMPFGKNLEPDSMHCMVTEEKLHGHMKMTRENGIKR